ncbi:MAG TPA: DUF1501 domain-containing protein [Steroidobacteraceae bacterium]|nr:DUF1501 domain-containing protein [Steroidobacteraceae bacterium]
MKSIDRREFLAAGSLAATGALLSSQVVFAAAPAAGESRLVLVILRGAVDGLAAVPPHGDADYARLRGELALAAPGGANGVLPLDGLFGLHPQLAFLHECYAAGELAVVHAVASPYRERSHFDGQDVLENGTTRPHDSQTGWLNRAPAALPRSQAQRKELGVALGQNVPLVMRGPAEIASWSPSRLATLDEDTLQRVADLYSGDRLLAHRLADALAADAIASGSRGMDPPQARGTDGSQARAAPGAQYVELVRAAAGFLRRDDGPRVAVFDTIGWDTHANEGGAQGLLAQRFAALDAGLSALKGELGPVWRTTAVVLVTEFGRTAAVNGTRGTDHGTATAAFLVGGAVRGRVIADWPGLAPRSLYEGRDLAPTCDLRSVLKGVLAEHLRIPSRTLEESVFPESRGARAARDLIRT